MAFAGKDDLALLSAKQHLNLSILAFDTMQSDMFAFGESAVSGFINRVLEHYRETAAASICWQLNGYRAELTELLSRIRCDEELKRRIIERLISHRKERLAASAAAYDGGKQFKFSLNVANLEFLSAADSECGEDAYYSTRGKYIKAVIEEYVRLPYVERERIWFKPYVDQINSALSAKKRLKLVTSNGNVYSFTPYRLLTDPLSTTNYLVGYGQRHDEPESEMRPFSFKLAALQAVKIEKSKPAGISKDQIKQLEQMLSVRGAQFMFGRDAEIRVRLTENGLKRYHRFLHLRPAVAETHGEVLTFRCTPAQAEFYFWKFGSDAEILEPKWLRDKFRDMYRSALAVYEAGESAEDTAE